MIKNIIKKMICQLTLFRQTSQPKIIQKRNDVELSIKDGIRIILSPEFETSKIIKIIDLLKDL